VVPGSGVGGGEEWSEWRVAPSEDNPALFDDACGDVVGETGQGETGTAADTCRLAQAARWADLVDEAAGEEAFDGHHAATEMI
jgi:hypothetical protein